VGNAEDVVYFEDDGAAFFIGEFAFGVFEGADWLLSVTIGYRWVTIGYYRLPEVTEG
jgi:hypothetical protein